MSGGEKTVGPWRVLSERSIFDNPWIELVHHDVTHPDGSPGQYGVVKFRNIAIGVLPIDENGMVPLVGQHRFPLDRYSWELPEGGGKLGVLPLDSAKRELAEETGLAAEYWSELCAFDVSNSVTDERAICFLAWGLTQGAATPEPSEALTVKQVSFKDLLEMVMSGAITDSLTIVMTLTACAKALRGELPEPISGIVLAALARK
ncbi:MAG: NUDIX hydrolase [Parvularculaceae bacterium]